MIAASLHELAEKIRNGTIESTAAAHILHAQAEGVEHLEADLWKLDHSVRQYVDAQKQPASALVSLEMSLPKRKGAIGLTEWHDINTS